MGPDHFSPQPAQTTGFSANPLAEPSTLPFGLPPFEAITADHFAPAFEAGFAEHIVEIEVITDDPAAPTIENTLVALERAGRLLDRTASLFFNLVSSCSTPEIRALETEFAPRMAAHRDRLLLDPELFGRVGTIAAAVRNGTIEVAPSPEELALIDRYHLDFVLAGARLGSADSIRLRKLNQQISGLATLFGQNLHNATEAAALRVTDPTALAGMSGEQIAGAGAAARAAGHLDGYLIPLILPSRQPLMSVLTDRETRRRLYEASINRASVEPYDNRPVAIEIARLRAERAALLGFPTHADLSFADQTAGSSAAVDELLGQLVGPAMENSALEAEKLARLAAADGVELAPWDWAFYSEKVKEQEYAVDTAALRPDFELDRVLHDGVFFAAERLYGLTFVLRADLAGYTQDVRVWEVRDPTGTPIGLYLGDYFAREGKRGGAWMNSFVDQSELLGNAPVVVNNLNIGEPAAGDPALLTLDEVNTLFHEFGHALHGLLSRVRFPRLSGTSVPRDFVEFPSQVNEMWALWPEVLGNYAVHVETGEPLPPETTAAIRAAELWGQGFGTVEYLAATLLDQAWHRISADTGIPDATAFEANALARAGLSSSLIPPRYRTSYFQHIFAGGYSAGYYSYIWSEVLDAETVEWFTANGGLNRDTGEQFRRKLLSVGGSVDSMHAFRSVVGRDPDIAPLLRRRGLNRTDRSQPARTNPVRPG